MKLSRLYMLLMPAMILLAVGLVTIVTDWTWGSATAAGITALAALVAAVIQIPFYVLDEGELEAYVYFPDVTDCIIATALLITGVSVILAVLQVAPAITTIIVSFFVLASLGGLHEFVRSERRLGDYPLLNMEYLSLMALSTSSILILLIMEATIWSVVLLGAVALSQVVIMWKKLQGSLEQKLNRAMMRKTLRWFGQ
jgi:hypothetical protein